MSSKKGFCLNVLLFAQQLAAFRSGVGTYAYGLVSGLSELGHEVTAVVPLKERVDIPGVSLIGMPQFDWDPSPGAWISLGVAFAQELKRRQHQFDVAHFADAREAWFISNAACRVTGMVNDAYALEWSQPDYPRHQYADRHLRHVYYSIQRKFEKAAYQKMDRLMVNSRHVRDLVSTGYGLEGEFVRTVYHGLELPGPVQPNRLAGSPALLFVGGNFQRKGLPLLIKAVAALKRRFPRIRLHVVGRDHNQQSLAELAARLGVGEIVTFHGWKPNGEVKAWIAGADIFVMPSLTEAFGFVYLEAMQLGTPVIATRIGGAQEVFREGQEAVFVDPNDLAELTSAIENIFTDDALSAALHQGGLQAAAKFTPLRMAEETEAVWKSLK